MGGDGVGWALDSELALTRSVLESVQHTGLLRSEVVHTVHWPALLALPGRLLAGKRVLSHMTHDPRVAAAQPGFDVARRIVGLWIVRSTRAQQLVQAWGLNAALIPYTYDDSVFHPLPKADPRIAALVERWAIPTDRYLIGSFQRDTEGTDLASPKLVKGPDILAQVVLEVSRRSGRGHVVLAGPRRAWIRRRLREVGVPFTFVGTEVEGDDLGINTLPSETMNILYNLVDVYLVSSRMEGGPQAVIEAAAAGCKVLSTDVGHARDILHPECIWLEPEDAARRIEVDITRKALAHTVAYNERSVRRSLRSAVAPLWREAYARLMAMPPLTQSQTAGLPSVPGWGLRRLRGRLARRFVSGLS